MKKLAIFLCIGSLLACNTGTTENNPIDSATKQIDSAASAKIDSVRTSADSIINKIDSAASAKIDTLQAKADTTLK